MINFDSIRASGDLLFESIRGSHLYGLNGPNSDIDTYGIWCCPIEWLLGSGRDYVPDIKSDKNDDSWVDLGKYIKLLEESNPDAIISLFTPASKILHFDPILEPLWNIRDQILSKACFKSFSGYAKDQLMKARGKNKKISINPDDVKVRKTPLDFCYVVRNDGGGSVVLSKWLKERGLKQEHCGICHIQPGKGMYYLYYNWGEDKESRVEDYMALQYPDASSWSIGKYRRDLERLKEAAGECITYRGIICKNEEEGTQLRLTSIPKEDEKRGPLCIFQYNQDAFTYHCKQYKEYWEWVEKRNQDRFVIDSEHGFNCYVDSETEFLTSSGWKRFDDITEEDLIGCWDNTNCYRFEKPISRIDKKYSGDIYRFESRYSKFSITANHNLYVKAYPLNGIVKDHSEYDLETYNWKFLPVKEYFEKRRSRYKFLGNLGNDLPDNPDFSDDFIRLLGYYISEGTINYRYKNGKRTGMKSIRIGVKDGCPLADNMREILTRYHINEYSYIKKDTGSTIVLWDWYPNDIDFQKILEAGIGAFNKVIPKYVYTFSKRQVDILIKSLIEGDGYISKKGHSVYYTFSKQLAEDLYTLLELNNYNAQRYEYKKTGGTFIRKDGKVTNYYQIMISKNNKQEHIMQKRGMWSKETVKDVRVVCFEMPNGTIITRNSNKIAFQGNSKNLSHCMRLMIQGMEIAQGKGLILDRTGIDADLLLDIKNHKMTYNEIMALCESKQAEMEEAFTKSTLRDLPPIDKLEELLIGIRRAHYVKANVNL